MSTTASEGRRVLVIGAGGQMTGRAVRALLDHAPADLRFVLSDVSEAALERVTSGVDPRRFEARTLDLHDDAALDATVAEADFVIHGAGPYHRTAQRVRTRCIVHGTDYMDIDDDVESGLEAIALDAEAREAGVAIFAGCGASPGLTNILARDLLERLEEPLDVEVAWCVGSEPAMDVGRAVAEHTLHIGAGDCVTWRDGRRVTHRSFAASTVFPMGPELGDHRVYECAHPETVMIPHSFPELRNVTCWGGLHPLPAVGLVKGVALAERKGHISLDEACAFLQQVLGGRAGASKVWRYAIGGALAQIRSGEARWRDLAAFVWSELGGHSEPPKMGLAARVVGRRDGQLIRLSRTTVDHGPGSALDSMEAATGLSLAAFALLALSGEKRRGCLFPEAWADPGDFLTLLSKSGERAASPLVSEVREESLA